jgi:hypothetical protein
MTKSHHVEKWTHLVWTTSFMLSSYVVHGSALGTHVENMMSLEGKWNGRQAGDHVCWVLNSKLSK